MPALNMEVTEVPVATPKITMGIEGGMITPMDPAVAMRAKVKLLL